MEQAEKEAAEAVLRTLLLTSQVVGLEWIPFSFTENRPESPGVHAGDEWPLVIPRP
jgi:hypothetical protein